MYVTKMFQDDWESGGDEGREIISPHVSEIEAFIRELDGERKTLVMLAADADAHMGIGGGENGRYVVYATYDNDEFFNLIDPDASASEDKVMLFIGGQEGDYSRKHCVSLDIALQAALTFAEDGSLNPSLMWERQ